MEKHQLEKVLIFLPIVEVVAMFGSYIKNFATFMIKFLTQFPIHQLLINAFWCEFCTQQVECWRIKRKIQDKLADVSYIWVTYWRSGWYFTSAYKLVIKPLWTGWETLLHAVLGMKRFVYIVVLWMVWMLGKSLLMFHNLLTVQTKRKLRNSVCIWCGGCFSKCRSC